MRHPRSIIAAALFAALLGLTACEDEPAEEAAEEIGEAADEAGDAIDD